MLTLTPTSGARPNVKTLPYLLVPLLWVIFGLTLPINASAQSTSPDASAPMLVTSTVEPWGLYDQHDDQTGILIDFLRILMANAGLEFRNQLKPYPRVLHEIATGQADLAVLFSGPQSDAIGLSLGKLTEARVIIVMRASDKPITTLEAFKGLKVGQVRGAKYGPVFDNNQGFTHVPVTNVDQGLRMLMTGRINAMASTEHSLLYAMYHSGIDSTKLRVALSPATASAHLYVSRHALSAPWLPAVQAAFNAMRDNGSLQKALYQKQYWPYESYCFAGGDCLNAQ